MCTQVESLDCRLHSNFIIPMSYLPGWFAFYAKVAHALIINSHKLVNTESLQHGLSMVTKMPNRRMTKTYWETLVACLFA